MLRNFHKVPTQENKTANGWATSPLIGAANNSIGEAAIISYAYVAANIPAEAIYWSKYVDNCGNPLTIGNNYVFNLTTRPPYNAFWSLTLYNNTDYFLIDTTNNTYTLGSQFPNLVVNSNGGAMLYLSQVRCASILHQYKSIHLYISNACMHLMLYLLQAAPSSPALESNWLPLGVAGAPANGVFYLIFRIYSPTSADVVNVYDPPEIQLADGNYAPTACP